MSLAPMTRDQRTCESIKISYLIQSDATTNSFINIASRVSWLKTIARNHPSKKNLAVDYPS